MKKLAGMLVLAFVFALVGCSPEENAPANKPAKPTTAPTTTAPAAPTTTAPATMTK